MELYAEHRFSIHQNTTAHFLGLYQPILPFLTPRAEQKQVVPTEGHNEQQKFLDNPLRP